MDGAIDCVSPSSSRTVLNDSVLLANEASYKVGSAEVDGGRL